MAFVKMTATDDAIQLLTEKVSVAYILTILHVVHYHKANTTTEAEGG